MLILHHKFATLLSICIPTYNFNITSLLEDLQKEITSLNVDIEIVVIDDCSTEKYKAINKECCSKVSYIELKENVGRSKIRNLFLSYTRYENLLFLDCDSFICEKNFIQNYLNEIQQSKYKIIVGGRIYPIECPSKNQKLSWKYGINIESKPAHIRNNDPYSSFMTNNFLVKKDVLNTLKFDENLTQYGHEDTLFGFELKLQNIQLKHIENPVLNGDIENNNTFVHKTELGIENLAILLSTVKEKNNFTDQVNLLRFYQKLEKRKITWLVKMIFIVLRKPILFFLKKGIVSLRLFAFYKLGYFIQTIESRKSPLG